MTSWFYNNTNKHLNNIYLPKESILCRMSNISIFSLHINFVPYDDTVAALHEGAKLFDVQCKHRGGTSPTNQEVGGLIPVSAPIWGKR